MSFKTWVKASLLEGFTPMAADDWPEEIADRWPRGRLRPSARAAYDHLVRHKEILPQGLSRAQDGAIIVRYKAKLPACWMHDILRRAEEEVMDA